MPFDEREKSYYYEMHHRMTITPEYCNAIKTDEDLAMINECLQNHYHLMPRKPSEPFPVAYPLKRQVALRIKFLSFGSARYVSAAAYPHTHPRHEMQWAGSDLKRWAAIVLGEIFTEAALVKRGDSEDFWHE